MFLRPGAHMWTVVLATARVYLKRFSAYTIELVRWPLTPLLLFATWRIAYSASGRSEVDGASVSGFLLVGVFTLITWTSSIWASGYAVEFERHEGTSGALFLSPASRAAVVAGYGLGSFVWFLPSFVAILFLGLVTGARLHVADPASVVLSVAALFLASLAAGFAFSGLFVLTRRGNLIANFIQHPILLLSGMVVPISSLPSAVRPLSNALPATHATLALRQSVLLGGTLRDTSAQLALTLGISVLYWLVGVLGLRRVEHVAKRAGQLDLY